MNTLIDENDVSPACLCVLLEQAVIAHSVDSDGQIHVHEPGWFPYWISHRPRQGLVAFSTYTEFREETTELERLRLSNEVSLHSTNLAVCVTDDRLRFDFALTCLGVMVQDHFVRTCRHFPEAIDRAIAAVDGEYVQLKRLREVCAVTKPSTKFIHIKPHSG